MTRYAIGVDYGTLSARAVVVDTATGRVAGSAAMDYPHGVMDAARQADGNINPMRRPTLNRKTLPRLPVRHLCRGAWRPRGASPARRRTCGCRPPP